jgi:hypothetical protein
VRTIISSGLKAGDLAADEDALNHRECRRAFHRRGVENELVQNHAPLFTEGEFGLVDEHQRHRAAAADFQHVALKNRRIFGQCHGRAIDPHRRHLADQFVDAPDRRCLEAGLGLGVLAGRQRPRQGRDQIIGKRRAARGHQRGGER